jgi:membrane protein YdbS with pleckstrin-like domain
MQDLIDRVLIWLDINKFYVIAYVVFITLFWFLGSPKMSAVTAYFGLCVIHLVFFAGVYIIKTKFLE